MLLQAGGGVKRGDVTEEPGQELTVNAGTVVSYTTVPQPPETFERIRNEMGAVSKSIGLYSFREQKEPPPGTAAKFRQPQQMVNEGEEVSVAIINAGESWTKLGYLLLAFVAKFYTEPRTIGIVGPDRAFQWRQFLGSDLSDLRATLRIDETSLYTWNRQSIRDTVVALLDTPGGQVLFQKPDGQVDRDLIMAAFDAAGLEKGFQIMDPDVLEARNENNTFRTLQDPQQTPPVQQWQNHPSHLDEHYKDRKGVSFAGWPQVAQQAFDQHIAQHEQAYKQQQDTQQQTMMDQESQLRNIRMTADSATATRSALGEALVQALVGLLSGELPKEPKGPPKKP